MSLQMFTDQPVPALEADVELFDLTNAALPTHQENAGVTMPGEVSGLRDMPDGAIRAIMIRMRAPVLKKEDNNTTSKLPSPNCVHAFIRPALSFALTCHRFYRIYRNCIAGLNNFKGSYLLQPGCRPDYCLVPLCNKLIAVHLISRDLKTSFCDIALYLRERSYGCEQGISAESGQGTFGKQMKISARLYEDDVLSFFRVCRKFREVCQLVVNEIPLKARGELWQSFSSAWYTTMQELVVLDTYCSFEHSYLLEIARMRNLKRLVINCQAIRFLDPVVNLTQLLFLNLRGCSIDDDAFEPVLRTLKSLQKLDIRDTFVSPFVTRALPRTILSVKAGEETRCLEGRLVGCGDGEYGALLLSHPDCRPSDIVGWPSGTENRGETRNIQFLTYEKLPHLQSLQWGFFETCAQGPISLHSVLPFVESLSLCGPDFDDSIVSMLESPECRKRLRRLRLFGCGCTDRTAYAISQLGALAYVAISSCPMSIYGIYGIADGVAFKAGVLQEMSLGSRGYSLPPQIVKQQLVGADTYQQ